MDIWLNTDSKVVLEKSDSPQRIVIINPEKLSGVSADELWTQISSSLGKHEFEMWLAREIVAISLQAIANGNQVADLAPIAGSSLYINYDFPEYNWKLFKTGEKFRDCLIRLPGFSVYKGSKNEILMQYVAK